MRINQVNFGKIIKVNAPYEIAVQIQDIANGKNSKKKKLTREINNLLPDLQEGEAKTFYWDKNTTFIFSGKEANEYMKSNNIDAVQRERIAGMLAKTYDSIKVIDPIYENKKLKSINREI